MSDAYDQQIRDSKRLNANPAIPQQDFGPFSDMAHEILKKNSPEGGGKADVFREADDEGCIGGGGYASDE